jgi:hypothetical protein
MMLADYTRALDSRQIALVRVLMESGRTPKQADLEAAQLAATPDPADYWRAVERHAATSMLYLPRIIMALLDLREAILRLRDAQAAALRKMGERKTDRFE